MKTFRTALLALAACVLLVPSASAQVVRAFTARYSINAPGDITLLGNTMMSCGGNGSQCTRAQAGTGSNTDDNDFNMTYVDVDADGTTFSSSTADLALPAGATVLWAGLYWGGDSNNAARNTCRFGTPLAGYATQTATQTDVSGTTRYSCFRDVTTLVQAGLSGTYRMANVYSTPGSADVYAGWALVVVYRDVTKPNRNLVVADGYALVDNTSTVTLNVSGFVTPPAGPVQTRLGVVTYEGDIGYTGDSFTLNSTTLSDALNPATNFFNSTISQFGANVTTKNPNYVNQMGFDIDLLSANGVLANGATSATIAVKTNGDTYYPTVLSFATDLYAPVMEGNSFTKSATDINGGSAQPGDVLEFTMRMQNTGQDNASTVVMRDTLASNLTYLPGSLSVANGPNAGAKTDAAGDDQGEYVPGSRTIVARLGTGATAAIGGTVSVGVQTTVKFRATITSPAPNGSSVANQAALAFNAAQLGTAFNTRSDADTIAAGFQPTATTVVAPVISGTVFEDVNYGGGAGRTKAASAGVGRPGARVELYGPTGALLQVTTTDAAGLYAFDGWSPGFYTVRVHNASVLSSRPGAGASNLGVLTFRTVATTGTAIADAARVGGEAPQLVDASANVSNQALAALTTGSATPQSITPVTLGTASIAGVDFGYNFDTIVNANDAGAGSLRQFLANAAALSNASLAQAGQPAGVETSIFMVSDGLAHPGLRAGLVNLLTGGVVRVAVLSNLPWLTDASTRLDGTTQTANVGDTNAGTLGAGGTVGAASLALGTVARPEVEIVDGAGLLVGLDVQSANATLRSLAIEGFGNATSNTLHADIRLNASAASATLDQLIVGASATAFSDPGAAQRSGGDHIRATGSTGGALTNSLIGFGQGAGVVLTGGANGWVVTGCQIESNGLADATADGLTLASSGTLTMSGNLVRANRAMGADLRTSSGANTIAQNTLTANGTGTGAAPTESASLALGGAGSTVDRNDLSGNYGAGVMVASGGSANVLTRNAVYNNGTIASAGGAAASGQVGIDLLAAGDDAGRGTSPYRTKNDSGDGDTGGNALLNFPVLEQATVAGTNLTLTGWVRPGSTIELFVADTDPSGFGEGRTWVATFVEGSGSDLDGATSSYSGTINGIDQGADNTNRFRFTVSIPAGVTSGASLTATATIAATGTSEFSGRVTVGGGVTVSGFAYADLNHDSGRDPGEVGTGRAIWVKLVREPLPQTASQVVPADPTTGAFAFSAVAANTYSLVLDDNATASDVTPAYPSGWIGTQAAPGVHSGLVVGGLDVANEDFGLWNGSTLDGQVTQDDGAGGGIANNGGPEGGEAGVPDVWLRLNSGACAGGQCDSVQSDGAGAFRLWIPAAAAGAVTVSETNAAAWLSTGARVGTTLGAYTRATDQLAFTAAAGTAYSGVTFGDVPPNLFSAGGAQSVASGAAALYAHRFTAKSAGAVTFGAIETPSPVLPGWSLQLVRDTNCNGVIDAGEVAVPPAIALTAGQVVCLVARHDSPAGATAGASEVAVLSASFAYSGAAPALSATATLVDLTSVLGAGGGLALSKSVDLATARPGDTLTYTITYTNAGSTPLSSIVIQDATPAYTVFTSASCGSLAPGLSACGVSTQPAVNGTGAVIWTLAGSIVPGASGSVTYQVKVQ